MIYFVFYIFYCFIDLKISIEAISSKIEVSIESVNIIDLCSILFSDMHIFFVGSRLV